MWNSLVIPILYKLALKHLISSPIFLGVIDGSLREADMCLRFFKLSISLSIIDISIVEFLVLYRI